MRILVCGSRNYDDAEHVNEVLDYIHKLRPIACLIHGDATGADTLAKEWAESRGIVVEPYPADWTKYWTAAGRLRNAEMLASGKPDFVLAFPGNNGTEDMVEQALAAGVWTSRVIPGDSVCRHGIRRVYPKT